MAVYDKNFEWTDEADALDNELRVKLRPILDEAMKSGLTIEDIHYIVGNYVFEVLLETTILKKCEIAKNK